MLIIIFVSPHSIFPKQTKSEFVLPLPWENSHGKKVRPGGFLSQSLPWFSEHPEMLAFYALESYYLWPILVTKSCGNCFIPWNQAGRAAPLTWVPIWPFMRKQTSSCTVWQEITRIGPLTILSSRYFSLLTSHI